MGSFLSRDVLPIEVTMPVMPMPLLSIAQSGKIQVRSIQQVGRQWSETFDLIDTETDVGRAFYEELNEYIRSGASFNYVHQRLKTLRGAGGGTPLVNGASQTGTSIVTDGWPASTTVLKVGDLVQFADLKIVHDVTANVVSNGSGQAAVTINPPVFAGSSPADDAPLEIGAVSWRVRIVGVEVPSAPANVLGRIRGLRITVRESVEA